MPDQILLGNTTFTAIRSVNLTRDADTPKHTLEDGSEISDHIVLRPAVFELEIELFPGEYDTLTTLYEARNPLTFVSPQGVWENMVITSLSDEYGKSSNTTRATVTLTQVRIVESLIVSLATDLQPPAKAAPDEQSPGSTTIQSLYVTVYPPAMLPDEPEPGTTWNSTLNLYAPDIEALKRGITPHIG